MAFGGHSMSSPDSGKTCDFGTRRTTGIAPPLISAGLCRPRVRDSNRAQLRRCGSVGTTFISPPELQAKTARNVYPSAVIGYGVIFFIVFLRTCFLTGFFHVSLAEHDFASQHVAFLLDFVFFTNVFSSRKIFVSRGPSDRVCKKTKYFPLRDRRISVLMFL